MTSPHPFAAWVERAQDRTQSPARHRQPRVSRHRNVAGDRVPRQRRPEDG